MTSGGPAFAANIKEHGKMWVRLVAFLAALGLTIAAAIVGNVLESKGIVTRERLCPRGIAAITGVYFGLFCLLCFTIVPLAIRFFIAGHVKIGNGEVVVIKWLREHENTVVFSLWGLFILGLIIIFVLSKDEIMKDLM